MRWELEQILRNAVYSWWMYCKELCVFRVCFVPLVAIHCVKKANPFLLAWSLDCWDHSKNAINDTVHQLSVSKIRDDICPKIVHIYRSTLTCTALFSQFLSDFCINLPKVNCVSLNSLVVNSHLCNVKSDLCNVKSDLCNVKSDLCNVKSDLCNVKSHL